MMHAVVSLGNLMLLDESTERRLVRTDGDVNRRFSNSNNFAVNCANF